MKANVASALIVAVLQLAVAATPAAVQAATPNPSGAAVMESNSTAALGSPASPAQSGVTNSTTNASATQTANGKATPASAIHVAGRGMSSDFGNPIVLITGLVVLSIIVLVGAAVMGLDKGVLASMGRTGYARGLITYLFAVTTVGTAAIVGLFALMPVDDLDLHKEQFSNAKEVLSLLLGIFGTIIGYYFGSEARKGEENYPLSTSPNILEFNPTRKTISFRTTASGGTRPLYYDLMLGDISKVRKKPVNADGIITFVSDAVDTADNFVVLRLTVTDSNALRLEQQLVCELKAAG